MNDTPNEKQDRKAALVLVGKVFGVIGTIALVLFPYLQESERTAVDRFRAEGEAREALFKAQAKQVEMLRSDVELLRVAVEAGTTEIAMLRTENGQLKMQIAALNAIISRDINLSGWLQEDMDALSFPAAVYKVGEEDGQTIFRSYLVNNAYTNRFGISKRRYVGRRASEVWGKKSAAIIRAGNLNVYQNRTWQLKDECYEDLVTGKALCSPVLRYYTTLPDGSDAIKVVIFVGMELN